MRDKKLAGTPWQEEENDSARDAYPAGGTLMRSAGVYQVHLPIDYLEDNVNSSNKYYLLVVGKTIRAEYFVFIRTRL
jgi:hypothetical protein